MLRKLSKQIRVGVGKDLSIQTLPYSVSLKGFSLPTANNTEKCGISSGTCKRMLPCRHKSGREDRGKVSQRAHPSHFQSASAKKKSGACARTRQDTCSVNF